MRIAAIALLLCATGGCAEPASSCEDGHLCGRVLYERRTIDGALELVPARHLRVTLVRSDAPLASAQLEATAGGAFALPLPTEGTEPLEFLVEATFVANDGTALVRVGEAEDGASLVAHRVWSWKFPVCGGACVSAIDVGALTIPEDAGSGAAHAFDWVVDTQQRVATHSSMLGITPPSVLVLWQDGIGPDCGSCYVPTEVGGAQVEVDGAIETFACAIQLSGTAEDPSQWSPSTLTHEASHWIMEGYSRWPNDLSVHDPSRLTRPGVAYTEGWATFNGQATLAAVSGELDPIARFGPILVDLDAATVNGAPVEAPTATGAVDQWVTETSVAALSWALLVDAGDDPMIAVLQSPRLLDLDRGYARADLIDLLDALACDGLVDEAEITRASVAYGFPWRADERLCP